MVFDVEELGLKAMTGSPQGYYLNGLPLKN